MSSLKLSEHKYGVHMDNYLTYAIRYNNRTAVEYLLNRDEITPLISNSDNKNALHFAVETENIKIISYLCEGSWNISSGMFSLEILKDKSWIKESWKALDKATIFEGYTPFHIAVILGNLEIVQYFVKIMNYRTKTSNIENNNEKFMSIEEMLECKAIEEMTPLLLAARYNNKEVFKYLLHLGASPYAINTKFRNGLHFAVMNRNHEIVQILSKIGQEKSLLISQMDYRGSKPIVYDKKNEFKLLLVDIWTYIENNDLIGIYKLFQCYKDKLSSDFVNIKRYSDGYTPLHYAVKLGHINAARLLIELGGDISLKDSEGKTALEIIQNQGAINKNELKNIFTIDPKIKNILPRVQESLKKLPNKG